MIKYANTYPNEVVGVLLIDPLTTAVTEDDSFKNILESERKLSYRLFSYLSILGFNRILNLFGLIPFELGYVANSLPDSEKFLFMEEWNK